MNDNPNTTIRQAQAAVLSRRRYVSRTLAALYGQGAAVTPAQYHAVSAMADRAAQALPFQTETGNPVGDPPRPPQAQS